MARTHWGNIFQVRAAALGMVSTPSGEGSVAIATLRSGMVLTADQSDVQAERMLA